MECAVLNKVIRKASPIKTLSRDLKEVGKQGLGIPVER